MKTGYKITEPTGKTIVLTRESLEEARSRVEAV